MAGDLVSSYRECSPVSCADLEDLLQSQIESWTTLLGNHDREALTGACQHEILLVNEHVARLLADIISPPTHENYATQSWTKLGVGTPLLSHDHELYMLQLRARNDAESNITSEFSHGTSLPLEYAWSAAEVEQAKSATHAIEHERLHVEHETLSLLANLVNAQVYVVPVHTPPKHKSFESVEVDMVLVPIDYGTPNEAITSPEIPNVSTSLPSDADPNHSHRIRELLEETLTSGCVADSSSEVLQDLNPQATDGFEALRVATPILPLDARSESSHPRVADIFNDPNLLSSATISDLEQDVIEFLDLAQPMLAQVEQNLRNEELIELDTTLRVPVPNIEGEGLHEVWESYWRGAQDEDLLLCAKSFRWSGLSRLERMLDWLPFDPRLGQIDFDEELEQCNANEHVHLPKSPVPVVRTPRSHGNFLLGSFEEPILLAPFITTATSNSTQLKSPARQVHVASSQVPDHQLDRALVPLKRPASNSLLTNMVNKRLRQQVQYKQPGPSESVADFSSFLHLHSAAARTMSTPEGPYTAAIADHSNARPSASDLRHNVYSALPLRMELKGSIICDPSTLTRHVLVCEIERRLPNFAILERVRVTPAGLTLHDADITIGPAVGVVLTTLQKLKQRPLPGQEQSDETIRSRVFQTTARYGKLFLLVSEGNDTATRQYGDLQPDDCQVLAEMVHWTIACAIDSPVMYVPGGDVELAAVICQLVHLTSVDNGIVLRLEESRHERLLRMLGLNAFAAQISLYVSAGHGYSDKSFSDEPKSTASQRITLTMQNAGLMRGLQKIAAQGWFQYG